LRQGDHDKFPAAQPFQTLSAPTEGIQFPREAGLKVGTDPGRELPSKVGAGAARD